MQCRDFREVIDSFLSDELLVETNHEVLRHLETCAECRNELTMRRELRIQLREAVKSDAKFQMRDEFAVALKAKLKETSSRKNQSVFALRNPTSLLAIAASLILFISVSGIVLWQFFDKTSPTDFVRLAEQMRHYAVGDHKNCAIQHGLKEDPISLEKAAIKYDKAYKDIDKAVMKSFPNGKGEVELLGAHACIFEGQKFAHVVLRYQNKVVSVLVTGRGNKDIAVNDTQAISCNSFEGYQISCFETKSHSVYIVSDLTEQDNLTIARQLQTSVVTHLS